MKTAILGLGLGLGSILGSLGASPAVGAEPPAPVTLGLWPGEAPGDSGKTIAPEKVETQGGIRRVSNVSRPTITVHRPEPGKNTGAAVVILPGGGYSILADDHEGDQVAKYLNGLGVTGIVLRYRVPRREGTPNTVPPSQALMDAQRALGLVRAHAKDWEIDPKRVGILGFSAGGHLAAWASNAPGDRRTYSPTVDEADKLDTTPNFTILIYPAYLLQKGKDILSPEVQAMTTTPPTFLALSSDDKITVDGSRAYARELEKAGVPVEIHVYDKGGHGWGMNVTDKPAAAWPSQMADWLRSRGLIPAKG